VTEDLEDSLRRTLSDRAATAGEWRAPGARLRQRAATRTARRRRWGAVAASALAVAAVLLAAVGLPRGYRVPAPSNPRPAPTSERGDGSALQVQVPDEVVDDVRNRLALGDAALTATTRLPRSRDIAMLFVSDQRAASPSRLVASVVTYDGATARPVSLVWVAPSDPVIALPVRDQAQDMLLVLATDWPEGEAEVTTAEPGQRPRSQSAPLEDGLAVLPVPGPQVVTGLRVLEPEPGRAEVYAQIPGGSFLPDEVPRWLPQIAAWSGTGSLQSVQVRTDGATACRFTVNGLVEHAMSWNLFDEACAPVDGRLHLLLAEDRQYSSVTGLAPNDAASVRLRWRDGSVSEVPVAPSPPYAFVDTSGRRPDRLISAEALNQRGDVLATERP